MNYKLSLLFLFIISLLLSCSTSKKISNDYISFDDLFNDYKSNFERINSISASGTISLTTKNFPLKLEFEMITLKDDKSLIHLFGPLGIYIGNIYLHDDSIMIHNNFNNKLIYASFSSSNLRKYFTDDINKNLIYSILLGYINPDQINSDSSSPVVDSGNSYMFSKIKNDRRIDFYFDKSSKMISEIKMFNGSEFILNMTLTGFIKDKNGIRFPGKIKFIDLKKDNWLEINFSEIDINRETVIQYPEIPEDVVIERW